MLLVNKKEDEKAGDPEVFGYASKYIQDELELIHDQQENIIKAGEELKKAFSEVRKIKRLLKIVKKTDKLVMEKALGEKRRQESSMINQMEDIKQLLKKGRYEDIERLLATIKHENRGKIKLSQKELYELREMMEELIELYKEAAGLCRLYRLVYDCVKKVYDECEQELNIETFEGEEFSRAGSYTEHVH
ncbi:hypothetical protein KY348_03355 [Candidatus Woesearchaeota archaeon]|nr:hypothetical protein [Candidatus Woesearchaeota archaeon]